MIDESVPETSTDSCNATGATEAAVSANGPEFREIADPIQAAEHDHLLGKIAEDVQSLRRAFDSKIRYDESKQQTIDALHAELQVYREGLYFRLVRPMLLDLIDLHNDLDRLLEDTNGKAPQTEDEARLLRNMESFQSSIEGLLYRHGVECYTEESKSFLAQYQRAAKFVQTDQSDLDGCIAERIRRGFRYDGKVLRHEIVAVYKFVS